MCVCVCMLCVCLSVSCRYFNRVKTGYDWNKYNSTHYDHDNPPPKTVQGYKFNVFFPDLIDKTNTPQYFVEACEDPQYAILRWVYT